VTRRLPTLRHDIEWRHARLWTGRRLLLRKPWLDIPSGTPCRVLCVVDFGDGPLFWIRTDDGAQRDVDQVTRRELETHFCLPDSARPPSRAQAAPASRAAGAEP